MKIKTLLPLAVSIALFASASGRAHAADPNHPVVQTLSGAVSGVMAADSHVVSFKGLPFAAPPVGDLRWRAPMPVQPWKGIRSGADFQASCMQHTRKEYLPWTEEFMVQNQVSEDCLYLNVWTPRAAKNANLPVIVFIHGGGFSEGSGAIEIYDGEALSSKGLVMVTINYRLGVFGFFAHPELTAESEHHSSGNYALMDQIAALRWVKDNIRGFGGDPERVAIWGQSAGAFSVGALIASPEAKGLFQRAQADSGLGIAALPMPPLKQAEEDGVEFAKARHAESIHDLRAIPASQLLADPTDRILRFAPILDGWILPQSPNDMNRAGTDNDVPVITGYQANDGALFMRPLNSPAEFDAFVHHMYGAMTEEFEHLYPAHDAAEIRQAMLDSTQDRDRVSMFLWGAERAKSHKSAVYTYFFDRAIPWPQHPEFQAFHTGEIPYFFENLKMMDRPWEPIDFQVAAEASSYLKAFATQGDPNVPGLPVWRAVDPNAPATMEIGAKTQTMPLASKERFDFWVRYFHSPEGKNAPIF